MSTGSTSAISTITSVTGDFNGTAQSIGFDFWLQGARYTTFGVNTFINPKAANSITKEPIKKI